MPPPLALRVVFQSAPPCGGRPAAEEAMRKFGEFQSAPPCGGRPPHSKATIARKIKVSIRAPVRGAT